MLAFYTKPKYPIWWSNEIRHCILVKIWAQQKNS